MRFDTSVLIALVVFGATPAFAAKVQLPGQVTYHEHVALPELATLQIELVDETMPNAPPRLDVRAPIGPGQVPLSFNLTFEDSLILPTHHYALIAAISDGGGLLFRNFEPYAVDPLKPAQPVLIVANLVAQLAPAGPSSAQPEAAMTPAIFDSTWTATEIAGTPVLPRSTPSLTIGTDMRAGGLGGCNSWFAQAQLDHDTLRFGSVTSTQKGCTQSINLQEKAFFSALAATATWRVEGDGLTLFGADGKTLLKFTR